MFFSKRGGGGGGGILLAVTAKSQKKREREQPLSSFLKERERELKKKDNRSLKNQIFITKIGNEYHFVDPFAISYFIGTYSEFSF